jgi:hypothetical protein
MGGKELKIIIGYADDAIITTYKEFYKTVLQYNM